MTEILQERGILNSQVYFNQNNPNYYKNSDYWRKPYDWHEASIRVSLNKHWLKTAAVLDGLPRFGIANFGCLWYRNLN